jgi:hypothetical protein
LTQTQSDLKLAQFEIIDIRRIQGNRYDIIAKCIG